MTTKVRPHGSRAKYVHEKCRCDDCRRAIREYERWRTRQAAYGRIELVDAEPVRQHIRALQAAGMGPRRIAALAGLHPNVLRKILYGDPRRGQAPTKRVRPHNARRILAVRASLDVLGASVLVDGTGTRRRLQALIALGWSQARLAEQVGMLPTNFGRTLRCERVRADTARTVRALYERMWDQAPPESTWHEKSAAQRARAYARRRGWGPPMAWDDDALDDPAATPHTDAGERVSVRQRVAEEYPHLSGFMSDEQIAAKFGIKVATLRGYLRGAA
ncbi:hypothetical protein B1813_18860 [Saccharomonospora piscinae]|uniref:Uncharacterized protein n=1 Tax=Saccharomonospora piscinae TaxID=687388 RepID=A0A1V8ZYT1_SACPI|nr:hypothetical protein [Saccharomonospora piscinae]OQO89903.1 hypothetical protein B1813_18860 [Saccharomonospora piscinae]